MIERVGAPTLAQVRAAYNAHYADSDFGDVPGLYQRIVQLLGPPPQGARILDIGCGSGPFLRAAQAAGLDPIGLDISDRALEKAADRGGQQLILAAGEALPFRDESFQWLVNLGNLEHFVDPAAGVREMARVLEPGGRALVMLPNAWFSGDLWRRLRYGQEPNHHQANDRFASRREWQRLLETGGLRVISVKRHEKPRWLKAWRWLLPLSLAYHFIFICERT